MRLKKVMRVHIGNNPELDKLVQGALLKAGFKWRMGQNSYISEGIDTYGDDYILIINEDDRMSCGGGGKFDTGVVGIVDLLDALKGIYEKEVVLNSSYTARVSKKSVVVGCQKFDADVILKVAETIKELRK